LASLPKSLRPYLVRDKHRLVDTRMKADVWFEPATVIEVSGANLTISPVHMAAHRSVKRGGLALRFPRFVLCGATRQPSRRRPFKRSTTCTVLRRGIVLANKVITHIPPVLALVAELSLSNDGRCHCAWQRNRQGADTQYHSCTIKSHPLLTGVMASHGRRGISCSARFAGSLRCVLFLRRAQAASFRQPKDPRQR